LMVEYNVFYGKFRLSTDTVLYFDTFVAAGVSDVELESGNTTGGVLDVGFAFWAGKNWSARAGLKNDWYNETLVTGEELNHNMIGYLSIGYLFGGN
jgi:outer membrane beta-barrel protein